MRTLLSGLAIGAADRAIRAEATTGFAAWNDWPPLSGPGGMLV